MENLTEEMEEDAETTIYDDYKFLTKEELEKLNLTNLIGTNLLRAYMHGFFIDFRLYKKAQSAANQMAKRGPVLEHFILPLQSTVICLFLVGDLAPKGWETFGS